MPDKPVFTGAYAPMQGYIAPLRGDLWRVIVGTVLMLIVYSVGILGYFFFIIFGLGYDADALVEGRNPASVVVFMFSFVFMALSAVLACLWPARRSLPSLFGPISAVWRDFRIVFLGITPVVVATFFATWAFDSSVTPNTSFANIVYWLPIALAVLVIQVTAEEMVFRGFIMGQLAARFASPLAWMIVPSALFGIVHHDATTYGTAGAWIVCAAVTYFAVLITDLTARTGNLGAAIAIHLANNILPIFLIGQIGDLDGLSLFIADFDPTDIATLTVEFLFVTLLWLAARLALKV